MKPNFIHMGRVGKIHLEFLPERGIYSPHGVRLMVGVTPYAETSLIGETPVCSLAEGADRDCNLKLNSRRVGISRLGGNEPLPENCIGKISKNQEDLPAKISESSGDRYHLPDLPICLSWRGTWQISLDLVDYHALTFRYDEDKYDVPAPAPASRYPPGPATGTIVLGSRTI